MTTIRNLSLGLFATAIALGAMAQTAPAPAASMPMAGTTMQPTCAKPIARHDHGAEKGTPTPRAQSAPCDPTTAAPAAAQAASAPKKRLNHDHAKFHKNS